MDEQKNSKASWEEAEQVGPYQLHEQVPQSESSQGELYLAMHETSGATALVLKPAAGEQEGSVPLSEWRVRIVSSAAHGYVALEAESTPRCVAPDRHSVESLVCTLEDVHKEVGRMAQALFASPEPRLWWRLAPALTGAAVVCAVLFALVRLAPVADGADSLASQQVPMAAETPNPFADGWLADTTPEGGLVLARPLPREPFKGQKRPPCTRYTEVELIGACWVPHKLDAPCPENLYEHQGRCYLPMFSAKPPPQSLGQ